MKVSALYNDLVHAQVEVTNDALLALIENYCREAGVRNLQKQIEKIYRNVSYAFVLNNFGTLICHLS
jgi:ATP-dependent Lon protease